jgi:hypothetical protein
VIERLEEWLEVDEWDDTEVEEEVAIEILVLDEEVDTRWLEDDNVDKPVIDDKDIDEWVDIDIEGEVAVEELVAVDEVKTNWVEDVVDEGDKVAVVNGSEADTVWLEDLVFEVLDGWHGNTWDLTHLSRKRIWFLGKWGYPEGKCCPAIINYELPSLRRSGDSTSFLSQQLGRE